MATQGYTSKTGSGERVNRPLAGLTYYQEHGHEFRSLGAGRYEAPSRSSKSKRYEVNIEEETCTCGDSSKGHHVCAHIYGVVIAASKPIPVKSRERSEFTLSQVMANIDRIQAS